MAHWTDGPEYAPTERPDVFDEPDAPQLGHADPEPDAAPRPPRDSRAKSTLPSTVRHGNRP